MKRILREYQKTAISEIRNHFHRGISPLVYTLATGGGKTAIAVELTKFFGRGLFIAPSLSVIQQGPVEFAEWGVKAESIGTGEELGTGESAWNSVSADSSVCCHYSSAWSALKQGFIRPEDFKILVVDECHHAPDGTGEATRIVEKFRQADIPVLGITATLRRLAKKQGFENTWAGLIQGPQWIDLMEHGYLAQVGYFTSKTLNYREIVGGRKQMGEYTLKGIEVNNLDNPTYTEGAIKLAKSEIEAGRRVIIYAVTINHAEKLSELAAESGIKHGILVSKDLDGTPDETYSDHQKIREGLKTGELQMVINVNIITEGYDCPDVETIIILRPTQSLPLFLQMCGRGSRKSENKEKVRIFDLARNSKEHGHPFREAYLGFTPARCFGWRPDCANLPE